MKRKRADVAEAPIVGYGSYRAAWRTERKRAVVAERRADAAEAEAARLRGLIDRHEVEADRRHSELAASSVVAAKSEAQHWEAQYKAERHEHTRLKGRLTEVFKDINPWLRSVFDLRELL